MDIKTIIMRPGDHFDILLPCGTVLNVEQTQDDFSIVRGNGVVIYTRSTNCWQALNRHDHERVENPNPLRIINHER